VIVPANVNNNSGFKLTCPSRSSVRPLVDSSKLSLNCSFLVRL